MKPLDGLLVVALEHAVAGPFATRQLADLGARVVKVERPGVGDFARRYDHTVHGQASYFVWLNRGKESVELDLKDPADRAVLDQLIARADVLVANLAPGALERLGLDAATQRARYPRLIHCVVSGYGPDGPYRCKKAYDLLVQCETGLLSITGTPTEPAKSGIPVADLAAGMYAYAGILGALLQRGRSGEGASLHVAMIDALAEWVVQPALFASYSGEPPRRTGAHHPSIAPYGPYPCRDGVVFLAVQNDREWAALCRDLLRRPELADEPRFRHNPDRLEHRDDVDGLVAGVLAGLDVADAEALLERIGIANARMRSVEELLTHPQLLARDRWTDVPIPGGATAQTLKPPVTVLDPPEVADRLGAVPALGEHNELIRAEFAPLEPAGPAST